MKVYTAHSQEIGIVVEEDSAVIAVIPKDRWDVANALIDVLTGIYGPCPHSLTTTEITTTCNQCGKTIPKP